VKTAVLGYIAEQGLQAQLQEPGKHLQDWGSLTLFQTEWKHTLPAAVHIPDLLLKSHNGSLIKQKLKGTLSKHPG